MKFLSLDSPLMNFLGKMADLMWLNILTMICCIPVFTIGASLTALHYMALKIVRNEECYITRGFFKSFKENFKQATIIWLIVAFAAALIIGDFYIILKSGMEFNNIFKIIIMVAAIFALFTTTFVFPTLAKFENTIVGTFKNAFAVSVLQFPKTIAMIVFAIIPVVLLLFSYEAFPFVFLFGMSLPALGGAFLYNKFFQKLEDMMQKPDTEEHAEGEDDERIFKDELDESIVIDENRR